MTNQPVKKPGAAGLWLGFGVVFALMAMAWAAMFYLASKHRPADVPLETHEAR